MHQPLNGVFRVLVCRANARLCGLPLDAVEETLRPQPLRPLTAPVNHVQGLARIRGDWLPVLDLAGLLGVSATPDPVRRFVVLRTGERRVALAVSEVIGVQGLEPEAVRALPPLLRDRDHAAVAALAERDEELLAVLDQARLLPDATSRELAEALPDDLPDVLPDDLADAARARAAS
ncbi:chemotaxis protein CheW [Roseateles sp. So40a]|uniref:chemotaxis protein CheW n=1 Tax=Roseateles sp. So40a TaxID=3400226 RepID=UPI003A878ADF